MSEARNIPTGIFAEAAPKFWAHGLRVIPIAHSSKVPPKGLTGWQDWVADIPAEAHKQELISEFRNHNIGLLLGSPIGDSEILIAIDVDDDRLVRAVEAFLSIPEGDFKPLLAGKIGKKGATFFARRPAGETRKLSKIKGQGGMGDIDLLGKGKQSVMPPSIHPETEKPYRVHPADILETELTRLPLADQRRLDVLNVALGAEQVAALVSGRGTHDPGVAWVARVVLETDASDDEIAALLGGLLPKDYGGNSLDELPEWIRSARLKKETEWLQPTAKPSLTDQLITIGADGVELFHDGDGNAYASISADGGQITVAVKSQRYRQWLRSRAMDQIARPATAGPLNDAVNALEAMALFKGPRHFVFNRVGGNRERVEIDIGDEAGRVVAITGEGWSVGPPTFKFRRGSGYTSIPEPRREGSLRDLQSLLSLSDANFALLAAFLLNALMPVGPYFALLVEGEQGSGKSFATEVIKAVLDPNMAPRLRLPDNERDLMIFAKEYRVLNFDNASGIKQDLSDALCALATGGGFATRALYTDDELKVLSYQRPFILNGIGGYANRPDLLERAIPLKLPPIPEGKRRDESELREELARILPGVLGALFDGVAAALKDWDRVARPRNFRMADAARWIRSGEAAIGFAADEVLAAIEAAQKDLVIERVNDEALVLHLRRVIRERAFEGYVADLFANLDVRPGDRAMPQSPSRLSNMLERLRPNLALVGIVFENLGKDRKGRKVRIDLTERSPNERPPFTASI